MRARSRLRASDPHRHARDRQDAPARFAESTRPSARPGCLTIRAEAPARRASRAVGAPVYIAVRACESVPGGVTAGLGRRDTFLPTDHLEIGFDPRHDHQTSYVFQVNRSGVQGDFVNFDDQRIDRDYDAVWEVRTQVTSDEWTAEFQIPFSQMRFSIAPDQPTVWGFMVRREIHRRGEQGQWVGRPRGEQGNVSRWGHLVFEAPFVSPPRRLELLPYVLGGRTEIPASAEAEEPEAPVSTCATGSDRRRRFRPRSTRTSDRSNKTPPCSICRCSRPSSPRSDRSSSRTAARSCRPRPATHVRVRSGDALV